jgi:hypothetical protein
MELADASDSERQPLHAATDYRMLAVARERLLDSVRALDEALHAWNDPLGIGDVIPGFRSGDIELIPSCDNAMKLIVFPIDIRTAEYSDDSHLMEPRVVSLHHVDNYQAHEVVKALDGDSRMRYVVRLADPTVLQGFAGSPSADRLASAVWSTASDTADQLGHLRHVLAHDSEFRFGVGDSARVISSLRLLVAFMPFLQSELVESELADAESIVGLLSGIQENAVALLSDTARLRRFEKRVDISRSRCLEVNPQSDVNDSLAQLGFQTGESAAQLSLDNSLTAIAFRALDAQIGSAVDKVGELHDEIVEWGNPQSTDDVDQILRRKLVDQLAARYDSVGQQLEDLVASFDNARHVTGDPELSACLVWISRTNRGVSRADAMRHAVENLAWLSLRLDEVGQRYQDVVTADRFGAADDADSRELAGIANATFLDLIARTRAIIGFDAD